MDNVVKRKKYLSLCFFNVVFHESIGIAVVYYMFWCFIKYAFVSNLFILTLLFAGCSLWSVLLLIQGICSFNVWICGKVNNDQKKLVNKSLKIYFIQLTLQYLMPITLFESKNLSISFLQTLITLLLIISVTKLFKKVDYVVSKYMIIFLFVYGISIILFYWIWIIALNL